MGPSDGECPVLVVRPLKAINMQDTLSINPRSDINRDVQVIRDSVDRYLLVTHEALRPRVLECMGGVLHCHVRQLAADRSLCETLGAESVDFMEILFRLQELFRIDIPVGAIRELARSGIESEFEADGYLTDRAVERLRILMPEVSLERVAAGVTSNEIPRLFTSDTFVRLVAWRLSEKANGHGGDAA